MAAGYVSLLPPLLVYLRLRGETEVICDLPLAQVARHLRGAISGTLQRPRDFLDLAWCDAAFFNSHAAATAGAAGGDHQHHLRGRCRRILLLTGWRAGRSWNTSPAISPVDCWEVFQRAGIAVFYEAFHRRFAPVCSVRQAATLGRQVRVWDFLFTPPSRSLS